MTQPHSNYGHYSTNDLRHLAGFADYIEACNRIINKYEEFIIEGGVFSPSMAISTIFPRHVVSIRQFITTMQQIIDRPYIIAIDSIRSMEDIFKCGLRKEIKFAEKILSLQVPAQGKKLYSEIKRITFAQAEKHLTYRTRMEREDTESLSLCMCGPEIDCQSHIKEYFVIA